MNDLHIAVVIGAVGPYHLARLSALHELLDARGGRLTLMLRNSVATDYPWFGDPGALDYNIERAYGPHQPNPKPLESSWRLWKSLELVNPDAVAFGIPSPAYIAVLAWAFMRGRKAILLSESKADDFPRNRIKEWAKRVLYGAFDGAVVGGQAHRDYAISLGIPDHRCLPGYDVIDNEHFARGAQSARHHRSQWATNLGLPDRYFVAANRFVPKKNLPRLMQAYAQYRDCTGTEAYPLVMLGDGPERDDLEELSRSLGLSDWVRFKGLARYADLPVYFGLAEAFIHASTVEQWGLVVNEAMASGLPVLISETCGCRGTLLREGENGYSFNPFSVEDISSVLVRFHQLDVERREEMSRQSQYIISDWGPKRFAQAVWEALGHDQTA